MRSRAAWDDNKAETNFRKHQVGFDEASTVFDDPLLITFLDIEHSYDEERYITIGNIQNESTSSNSPHRSRRNRADN